MSESKIAIAYDCSLKRPGCVIVQALFGGDGSSVSRLFPAQSWLTTVTPDMKLISGTPEEWQRAKEITLAEMQRIKDSR